MSGDTRQSSKSPPFYCLIITILSLFTLPLAYLLGSCKTQEEQEVRKSSRKEGGLSLRPLFFFLSDYSASTTRDVAGTFCSLPVQLLYPAIKSLPSLSECHSSTKHTVYRLPSFILFCLVHKSQHLSFRSTPAASNTRTTNPNLPNTCANSYSMMVMYAIIHSRLQHIKE